MLCCAPSNCHIDWFKRMPVILQSTYGGKHSILHTHKKRRILHDVLFSLSCGITDKTSVLLNAISRSLSAPFAQSGKDKETIDEHVYRWDVIWSHLFDRWEIVFEHQVLLYVHTKWILKNRLMVFQQMEYDKIFISDSSITESLWQIVIGQR